MTQKTVLHLTDNLAPGGSARVMESLAMLADKTRFRPVLGGVTGEESYVDILRQKGHEVIITGSEAPSPLVTGTGGYAVVIHRSGEEQPLWNMLLPQLKESGAGPIIEIKHFGYKDAGSAEKFIDLILCVSLSTLYRNWIFSGRPDIVPYLARHQVLYNPVVFNPTEEELQAGRERLRRELNIPPEAVVIGSVYRPDPARIDPIVPYILPRLCKRHPEVHYIARSLPSQLDQWTRRKLGKKYHPLPFDSDHYSLVATYGCMDILAHFSSMGESFGMAIAEAMRSGLPVVSSPTPALKHCNGQCELIAPGKTGFLASSASSIFAALEKLINEPSLRHNMGIEAKKIFTTQPLSPEGIIRQLEEALVATEKDKDRNMAALTKWSPTAEEMSAYINNHGLTEDCLDCHPVAQRGCWWSLSIAARKLRWQITTKLNRRRK